MSRGFITVNIPESDCRECQCFREQFPSCGAVGRFVDPIIEKRPDWCPIRKEEKPEDPYLLLTEDSDGSVSYCWWDNERDMVNDAIERKESGEKIIMAIEISSYRNVEIPEEYTVDDFIESVESAYDDAKTRGFDSIVIAIDTDVGNTYCINETPEGFQCDFFDYVFDDLYDISCQLYDEIIGKVAEIRIE